MTKAQDYYARARKLIDGGMSATAAFTQVAEDVKSTKANVQTGYYREHRKVNGTAKPKAGKAKAARTRVVSAARTHVDASPSMNGSSELDTLRANVEKAVSALRAYQDRETRSFIDSLV